MASFNAESHQGKITVSRALTGQHIELTPSEVNKATHLIGLVLSMAGLDQVPDNIRHSPFVIRLFPKKEYAIEREDADGSLPFRWREGDELIDFFKMGLAKCLNEQTQGRVVPRSSVEGITLASDESF